MSTDVDRAIADLSSTLGDATRRGIYLAVREASRPLTATEVAARFEIHPNVARHHLDRLVEEGYLRVTRGSGERRGPGAGRPAKHYEATGKRISVEFPRRRYDLLVELLVRTVERLAPEDPGAVAEEVARDYGRALGEELGIAARMRDADSVVEVLTEVLRDLGFDAEVSEDGRRLLTRTCPFGEASDHHPITCRIDQGIVSGLLEAARRRSVAVVTPHAEGDRCVTEL
ncbi:MAG TPA: ArsR family transcriptional regulator [Actinobacteria bacterium]|nr:ArsR family transcriptional regulator [Actinomycetota bacterium]